jgi:general secretion pathway protein K
VPHFPRQSAGFVIVAALWIVAALATLAMMYSFYVRETALEFVDHDERLQAQALAASGVELASYQLTKNLNARPLEGRFTFAQGSATINVTFRSENSRIDLNFASRELLTGLLSGLGVEHDEALTYADHIVAWRTPRKSGQRSGALPGSRQGLRAAARSVPASRRAGAGRRPAADAG